MDYIDPNKDDGFLIQGFRKCVFKSVFAYIAILLSGFTLLLIFYWKPELHLYLTHVKTDTASAEKILLITKLGETTVCQIFVQNLWSNRVSRFTSQSHTNISETSPISQDTLIDGLPTSVKFFIYRSLKYIWNAEKMTYIPMQGLDNSLCSSLIKSTPLNNNRIDYLATFYGSNLLEIQLTPIITKIYREILTPFYVFQVFSVALWMSTSYYMFASVILVFSVVSIFLAVFTCRRNEIQLRNKVKMAEQAIAIRANAISELPSSYLVPGDILCIPKSGAEMTADVLLLDGDCIVNESALTGESVPQTKTFLTDFAPDERLDFRAHSRHLLFSGTTVLQARPTIISSTSNNNAETEYVKALVLRTGFLTTKGSLLRSILYPKPLDVDFTLDCFRFLSVMAIIALGGSIYTWIMLSRHACGVKELLQKSLDILTIVVPPALPAVMTTGLFFAQLRLKKLNIFCINPSAINIAGTLNTIIFDKTGTLTEEDMSVKGIWDSGCPLPEDNEFYQEDYLSDLPYNLTYSALLEKDDKPIKLLEPKLIQSFQPAGPIIGVLAACHSLALAQLPDQDNPQVVGDPLDNVIFKSTNWILSEATSEDVKNNFGSPVKYVLRSPHVNFESPWHQIGILRHFPFSSIKQRQSVVVQTVLPSVSKSNTNAGVISVLAKGSLEVIVKLCNPLTVPKHFKSILEHFTSQGYRVLALAWKPVGRITDDSDGHNQENINYNSWDNIYHTWKREMFECDLRLLGLVILDNPIKPESAPTIRELLSANFRVLMATGDDLRTGLSVARQCGFISSKDEVIKISPKVSFKGTPSPSHMFRIEVIMNPTAPSGNSTANQLADPIVGSSALIRLLQSVLSCGKSRRNMETEEDDERNILQAVEEGTFGIAENGMEEKSRQHIVVTGETWNLILKEAPELIPMVLSHGTVFARFLPEDKTSLVQVMQTASLGYRVGMCGDGANDCGALKAAYVGIALSDCEASIAAPFTSQQQNISCVANLLKEGRCSLSTAIGSFKYMVLYSFIQFFSVLILYYIGNVLSDAEFLIIDLFVVTPLSITIAASLPWRKLEAKTPSLRLLTPSNLLSVLSQLLLVILTQMLVFVLVQRQSWWTKYEPSPGIIDSSGSFEATSIFYFSMFQYATVCLVFAKGPPFRDCIYRNKFFMLNIVAVFALCIGLLFCPIPWLAYWAMFLPLNGEGDTLAESLSFPTCLLFLACVHAALSYLSELCVECLSRRFSLGCCPPRFPCCASSFSLGPATAYQSIDRDLRHDHS